MIKKQQLDIKYDLIYIHANKHTNIQMLALFSMIIKFDLNN